ncbi:MAG: aldehyde dehydrogenase family protein [Chitinophagaceae bacterium]|nr:aldehyde dehydrogenase family protein [Chitinophagaceae bacterium]
MYILRLKSKPLCSITFAEVINSSDVPGGVVNILTGKPSELASIFDNHMDVNAVIYCENDTKTQASIKEQAAENVKRVHFMRGKNWNKEDGRNHHLFHHGYAGNKDNLAPIENIGGGGSKHKFLNKIAFELGRNLLLSIQIVVMKLTLVFCFCRWRVNCRQHDKGARCTLKDSRADLLVKKQIEINELNTT